MMEELGPITEEKIKFEIDRLGDYNRMRKLDGTPYIADPVKAIKGALHELKQGGVVSLRQ